MRKDLSITFAVIMIMAFGFALSPVCRAADTNKATEADMAQIRQEGSLLISQRTAVEKKIGALLVQKENIQQEGVASDLEMEQWNRQAQLFNARCNHPFYTGEEAEYASCQEEQRRDAPVFARIQARQAAVLQRAQDWKTQYNQLDQEKQQLVSQYEAWERRLKAVKVAEEIQKCISNSVTGTPEEVVNAYQICWDGARKAEPLGEVQQGTQFFGITPNPKTADQRAMQEQRAKQEERAAAAKKKADERTTELRKAERRLRDLKAPGHSRDEITRAEDDVKKLQRLTSDATLEWAKEQKTLNSMP